MSARPVAWAPAPPRTNALAIVSLVLGLCGFGILPVIFGHIALGQIRRSGDRGATLAIVGLVLGYLALVATVIGIGLLIAVAVGVPVFATWVSS
jgi:hypothetical protein